MTHKRKGVEDLKAFFSSNPKEELTIDDAAMKLGILPKSAGSYLATLKSQGILERVSIYRVRQQ